MTEEITPLKKTEETTIVVAGDVTADWFFYSVEPGNIGENWRLNQKWDKDVLPGGAALLTKFIENAVEEPIKVIGPRLPEKQAWRTINPEQVVHSNVILKNCKSLSDKTNKKNKTDNILRIKEYLGYVGPKEGKSPSYKFDFENSSNVGTIVLDDAGNGFREREDEWTEIFSKFSNENINTQAIIYKMSIPLLEGKLWKNIKDRLPKNLILIVNAEDIRRTEGIHISKSLSWERTAKDLMFELQHSGVLNSLYQCPYFLVLFDTDGAILYCKENTDGNQVILVFDPSSLEGGFASSVDGKMMGITSIFTATIVKQMILAGFSNPEKTEALKCSILIDGIKQGLTNARSLLEIGYKKNSGIDCPSFKEVSNKKATSNSHTYTYSYIEPPIDLKVPDPKFWRILDHNTLKVRQRVASEIVTKGKVKGLENVPICKFGNLETIDRAEIESYSSIKELISEFLLNPKPNNPLCFAVFGPPGSGKSTGVKQILESIDSYGDKLESIFFNVSQFEDYQDLVNAFHSVRDIALSGKIPFVFFDEFDSNLDKNALGWLKYFLLPMQDGKFKEGDMMHPLGNAILVFAGGTRYTFEAFEQNTYDKNINANIISDELVKKESYEKFRNAKGPDFVSRLRGFINVMGPNRQRTENDYDDAFIIRRAQIIRESLRNSQTAKDIFNSDDTINIDDGVLRAMLNVTNYKHGKRSIVALIEMSRLAGKNCFDRSALPIKKQLEMHVDADEFLFLMEKERYQSMLLLRDLPDPDEISFQRKEDSIVELVANCILKYYMNSNECREIKLGNTRTFELLYGEAIDIPTKLRKIECGIQKKESNQPELFIFTSDDMRILIQHEYERRCCNQLFGMSSNFDKLLADKNNCLEKLIKAIPEILLEAGFEIYRIT